MDDIERLIRDARPASGHRERPLSARAERELDVLIGAADAVKGAARRDTEDDRPSEPELVTRNGQGTSGARRGPLVRPRRRSRRLLAASLAFCVLAIAAVAGITGVLDGAPQAPRLLAGHAAPDPSSVLIAAAEELDGASSRSESSSRDESSMSPQTTDRVVLVDLLVSGDLSSSGQALLLRSLAASGRPTSATRTVEEAGGVIWRVRIDGATLVIRADSGLIEAVVDVDGVEHTVPVPSS